VLPSDADRFDTVVVNNTFHQLPPGDMVGPWQIDSPHGFFFVAKANRHAGHVK